MPTEKPKFYKNSSAIKRKALVYSISITIVFLGFMVLQNLNSPKKTIKKPKPLVVSEITLINIEKFELNITKIGVTTPVVPNVTGEKKAYLEALKNGVAHLSGTALPDSGGNTFIFGHSSTVLGIGEYSEIFSRLNELDTNDEIEIKFNNKAFIYLVAEKKIVEANDKTVLNPTKKEQLTLMTCWPIGSDAKRIIVIAKRKDIK